MHKLKVLLFLFFPISIFSQNITGKVYDDSSTIKGATIYNTTTEYISYTNEKGEFELNVSINDTLHFYSLFHHKKSLIVNKNHFNDVLVIELEKAVNELGEVLLSSDVKPLSAIEITENLGEQLKNDMKANPHLYSMQSSGGLDFIKIAGLIGSLFKKKKIKDKPFIPITYKQLDSLFARDKFFNKRLLSTDLKIPEDYNLLFFDYCDAQQIDSNLLLKENHFLLLDELLKYSNAFLEILSNYKKD